jgi:hypothetical protein
MTRPRPIEHRSYFSLWVAGLAAMAGLAGPGVDVALGDPCPNAALRTGPSAGLADCRAYEQVSPAEKGGFPVNFVRQVGDGEGVVGESIGLFSDATGSPLTQKLQDYFLYRGSGGWKAQALDDAPVGVLAHAGSEGSTNIVSQSGETLQYLRPASSSIYEVELYRSGPAGFVPIGPVFPPSVAAGSPTGEDSRPVGSEYLLATTPDLSHVVFTIEALQPGAAKVPPGVETLLWPGDPTVLEGQFHLSLYEYSGVGNAVPRLVGVDNQGVVISRCATLPGGNHEGNTPRSAHVSGDRHNALSVDGGRVFFTAEARGECGASSGAPVVDELFARADGGAPQSPVDGQGGCTVAGDACTVAISEPQAFAAVSRGDCTGACAENTSKAKEATAWRPATFLGASADGSKVFFTSNQQLVDGAVQDPAEGSNLYEYDFSKPAGERLSSLSGGDLSGVGPDVQGVGMVSEDGSQVYFVSKGVLTREPRGGAGGACLADLTLVELGEEEASKEGLCRAKAGADNLYVRDTVSGSTVFVASLSPEDAEQWEAGGRDAMEVTDNDRYAVFTSQAHLTRGDTASLTQVFRYTAATGALTRVSVGEGGLNHDGNLTHGETLIPRGEGALAGFEEIAFDLHPAVSEDGVVVFTSSVRLTEGALEEECAVANSEGHCEQKAQNVYEYEDGHVYLVSYGGPHTGIFEGGVAISASGQNIYFQSTEQLAPQDHDSSPDIYDARVNGGFPAASAAVGCSGEGCQQPAAPVPVVAAPGSATFTGPVSAALPVAVAPPRRVVLTRAQKLAKALKLCKKDRARTVRARCERLARGRYAPPRHPRRRGGG